MVIPTPSSFNHLSPPKSPSNMTIRQVASLRQSIIKQAGLKPGVYSSANRDVLQQVTKVYDGLMNALKSELSGLDAFNLCVNLYERNEQFVGHINRSKYHAIPDILEVGSTAASEAIQDMWMKFSPYTISIKWLIEICVKCCQPCGTKASESKLDLLIELARTILEWDTSWESIYYGVIQHEVNVHPDFNLTCRPTGQTAAAVNAYRQSIVRWKADEDRNWTNDIFQPRQARTKSSNLTVEENLSLIVRDLEWGPLSKAMEAELGYSAIDWLRYSFGLLDSFEYTEYIKVIPKDELCEFMSRKWRLTPERFDILLTDHALSKQILSDNSLDQLRPTQHARRDTRLIRRPVVLLEGFGSSPICLYGIETLETSRQLFLNRFPAGRCLIPRMSADGPVKKAIGGIQTNLGDMLRDEIADQCNRNKYEVAKEKGRVKSKRIPEGAGFGPVDVFIVDRQFRRFVLAEAKDIAQPGAEPSENRDDFLEFRRYVGKMEKQLGWFRSRVESLKYEFGIAPEEHYTVEGVIIVNYPRLWMFDHQEQLPVVADKDFYEMLERGDRFLTTPV